MWSTTPWTLPANVAAAVNPELDYVEVSSPQWGHTLILAEKTLHVLAKTPHKIEKRFKGAELVGLHYETFFPDVANQPQIEHRVVAWSDVEGAEGSGIVHIAPGCGREDYELGLREGLTPIKPVDESGRFFSDFGPWAGRAAGDVAKDIAAALEGSGKLLRAELYRHSYPVCWRCKHELIFRLVRRVVPRLRRGARQADRDRAHGRLGARLHRQADGGLAQQHGRLVHLQEALLGTAAALLSVHPVRTPARGGLARRAARARGRSGRCRRAAASSTAPGSTTSSIKCPQCSAKCRAWSRSATAGSTPASCRSRRSATSTAARSGKTRSPPSGSARCASRSGSGSTRCCS